MDPDTDPGGPKPYGSGLGSATPPKRVAFSHHQAFIGTCGGEEARLYVLQLVKIVQRAQVARIKVWEPAPRPCSSSCRLLAHLPHRRGGGLGAAAIGGNVVALQGGEGAGSGLSIGEEGLQSHLLHRLQDAQASTFRLQPSLLPAQTNCTNQCCGSESGFGFVGSVCFWASWIRIRNLLSSKNNKKKYLPTIWWLFFDFLSWKMM